MRYRAPIPWIEHAVYSMCRRIFNDEELRQYTNFLSADADYPISYVWQSIIAYLYSMKAVSEPRFMLEDVAPGEADFWAVRVQADWSKLETSGRFGASPGFSRGVSLDLDEALSKCVGEFLERYPQMIYHDDQLLKASSAELSALQLEHVAPREVCTVQKSDAARPELAEITMRWVSVESIGTEKKILLPAQLVFWNYRFLPNEPVLRDCNSAGSAGHFTPGEAVRSGLFELVERDAFLFHWFTKATPSRIDTASLHDTWCQGIIDHYKALGVTIHILDVTNGLQVPTVTICAVNPSGVGPYVSVCAKAGTTITGAIKGALQEFLGIRLWQLQNLGAVPAREFPSEPFTEKFDVASRMHMWNRPERIEQLDWLLQGELRTESDLKDKYVQYADSSPEKTIKKLQTALAQQFGDDTIYTHTFRHKLLQKLGYCSVKVVVPALLPMQFNERNAPLLSPRLHAETVQNTRPHPFP